MSEVQTSANIKPCPPVQGASGVGDVAIHQFQQDIRSP